MAGEHILKLLIEENARVVIDNGRKILFCNYISVSEDNKGFIEYSVGYNKPYAKKMKILIKTVNEEDACRILKGE